MAEYGPAEICCGCDTTLSVATLFWTVSTGGVNCGGECVLCEGLWCITVLLEETGADDTTVGLGQFTDCISILSEYTGLCIAPGQGRHLVECLYCAHLTQCTGLELVVVAAGMARRVYDFFASCIYD